MTRIRKPAYKRNKKIDAFWGWLFVAPLIVGLGLFFIYPLVYAIILSFTNMNGASIDTYQFIGFDNYAKAFQDPFFGASIGNAFFNALGVPIGMFIALILATFINSIKKGSTFFRVVLYIPAICGAIALTFIWRWMYQENGLINMFLTSIGIPKAKFLIESNFMVCMIVMGIWAGTGTSILLIYAALKGISKSLYEAASIDGASAWDKFWHVTVPGVSPILFYILLTGILGSLQDFARFQAMADALTTYTVMPVWYIFIHTGSAGDFQYGYASAMGVILALIILGVSGIQYIGSKFWVKYAN